MLSSPLYRLERKKIMFFERDSVESFNLSRLVTFLGKQQYKKSVPALYNDYTYQQFDDYEIKSFIYTALRSGRESGLPGVLKACDDFELGENFKIYFRKFFEEGIMPVETVEESRIEAGKDPETNRSKLHPIPCRYVDPNSEVFRVEKK